MLSLSNTSIDLTQGVNMLFQVDPMSLEEYLEFTFTLCTPSSLLLTLNLYGETGTTTEYNDNNQLGNTVNATFTSGCSQITSPYISFGTQPNG